MASMLVYFASFNLGIFTATDLFSINYIVSSGMVVTVITLYLRHMRFRDFLLGRVVNQKNLRATNYLRMILAFALMYPAGHILQVGAILFRKVTPELYRVVHLQGDSLLQMVAFIAGGSLALLSVQLGSDSLLVNTRAKSRAKKLAFMNKHFQSSDTIKSLSIITVVGSLYSLVLKNISDDWATLVLGISFMLFIAQFLAFWGALQSLSQALRKLSLFSS